MPIDIYQSSIPVFIHMLGNVSAILKKAEQYAKHRKIDPDVLINARLAPDMYPLVRQIQIATDVAKGCGARLSELEVPSYPDTESNFEQLQTRLSKTLEFLKSLSIDKIKGSEDRTMTLSVGGRALSFPGDQYVFHFAMPNFYFHVSMTYAILRHHGLEIGKKDYLG